MISPVFEELSSNYENIAFHKVDVDEQAEIAEIAGIKSVRYTRHAAHYRTLIFYWWLYTDAYFHRFPERQEDR